MAQGDPLYPTIFNLVVDAVVRHWVSKMEEGEEGPEGWGREVKICISFFYADNNLIDPTNLEWIQGTFDNLTVLFYRIWLWKNAGKMVDMI